jgi:hypothetical protein
MQQPQKAQLSETTLVVAFSCRYHWLGVGDIVFHIWSDFLTWFRLKNKMIEQKYCYSCAMDKMISLGNFWFAYP